MGKTVFEKKVNKFIIGLSFFYFTLFFYAYNAELTIYNSSLLAFNYEHGLIPRAFLGTIYQLVDFVLPVNMYSYGMAMRFVEVATAIFYLFMIWLARKSLLTCGEKHFKDLAVLWIAFGILFVTMFACKKNFGRVDMFMLFFDLIGLCLILYERAEWLIIFISVIQVMIHEGYVFMYFNILLVVLFYKIMVSEKKRKYVLIFALSFLGSSFMFLYFHFFMKPVSAEVYMEVYRQARKLSVINMPHVSLLAAELLGVNLADIEVLFHKENFVQLPMFLVLILPYLILFVRVVRRLLKKAEGLNKKLAYLAVAVGALTLLPNFLLKVDYGRWIFALFSYYFMVVLALYIMRDETFIEVLKSVTGEFKNKYKWGFLLLMYPVLLVPFWDVYINKMLKTASDLVNVYLQWY